MKVKNHILPVLLAVVIGCKTGLRADTAFTNWPATPDWTALTNHISWCYQAIQQRNQAVGTPLSTNDFAPTYIYPYCDYVRFARAVDGLATSFVNQCAADGGDFPATFYTYFSTPSNNVYPVDFPLWNATDLHTYAFGAADWSTGAVLHSWLAQTNLDLMTQVQNAITNLVWSRQANDPNVQNGFIRWAEWSWDGSTFNWWEGGNNDFENDGPFYSVMVGNEYNPWWWIWEPQAPFLLQGAYERRTGRPSVDVGLTNVAAHVSYYFALTTSSEYSSLCNDEVLAQFSTWVSPDQTHVVPGNGSRG